jgi:hypothetical protein
MLQANCVCELGIFGVILTDGTFVNANDEVSLNPNFRNLYAGYLLRVKPADVDEGGVAAGFAVLSCPLLC